MGSIEIDPLSERLVTLTAFSWTGAPPQRGDYILPVGPRARSCYLIAEVRFNGRPHPASYARLRCWRVGRAGIPAGATVHDWFWRSRG